MKQLMITFMLISACGIDEDLGTSQQAERVRAPFPAHCPTSVEDQPTVRWLPVGADNEGYWPKKHPRVDGEEAIPRLWIRYKPGVVPKSDDWFRVELDYVRETGGSALTRDFTAKPRIDVQYGELFVDVVIRPHASGSGDTKIIPRILPGDCYTVGDNPDTEAWLLDRKDPKVGIDTETEEPGKLSIDEGDFRYIALVRDKIRDALDVRVTIADGSATCGDDYTTTYSCNTTATISFAPGERYASIRIDAIEHADHERPENLIVQLQSFDRSLGDRTPFELWTDAPYVTTANVDIIDTTPDDPPPADDPPPPDEEPTCDSTCGPADDAVARCCSDGEIYEDYCCNTCWGLEPGSVCIIPI